MSRYPLCAAWRAEMSKTLIWAVSQRREKVFCLHLNLSNLTLNDVARQHSLIVCAYASLSEGVNVAVRASTCDAARCFVGDEPSGRFVDGSPSPSALGGAERLSSHSLALPPERQLVQFVTAGLPCGSGQALRAQPCCCRCSSGGARNLGPDVNCSLGLGTGTPATLHSLSWDWSSMPLQ